MQRVLQRPFLLLYLVVLVNTLLSHPSNGPRRMGAERKVFPGACPVADRIQWIGKITVNNSLDLFECRSGADIPRSWSCLREARPSVSSWRLQTGTCPV
ncbi:hypothetical protein EDB87DRAFT_117228 [Lactarius vividus]|nr:hypothetical protein EDB87DRAFT_117228 [Lactarius vividus]